MEEQIKRLAGIPLFDRIEPSELAHMLGCIGGFFRTFDAGSYMVLDGDSVECVGVVVDGTVHMVKEDVWGGKTIMAVIEKAQVFGETCVFGTAHQSYVSFVAMEKTEVLLLPFKRVLHTCSKSCAYHQKLVDNMVAVIAHNNQKLTEKLEVTTKRSLRAKILTYLSQEAQKADSKYFTVPLGRLEMAEFLCADRCALTRELTKMRAEGILDYNGNTFRLL